MPDVPEYLDSVGRLLGFAARAVNALTSEKLAQHGLTLPQWIVLTALWREDGLSVTNIAQYTKSKVPATSRLLGRMEEQGLVTRRSPEGDRRSVQVFLTPKAKAMSGVLALYEDINQMILEGFSTSEKKRAVRYLQRMITNTAQHYAASNSSDPLIAK